MRIARARQQVYEELLRFLATTEGFVLVPVEVPDDRVGEELAAWLRAHAHPVRVVRAEPGRELVHRLLGGERGAPVMVLGETALAPEALGVLNQRRDTVSAFLEAPLLWCGPPAFLYAPREAAPDFWSTRALPRRVATPGARIPTAPRWTGPLVPEGPDALAALRDARRAEGDTVNAARLAYLRAAALAARSRFAEARGELAAVAADLPLPDDLRFDLDLLAARLALVDEDPEGAADALARARRLAGESPGRRAQLDLVEVRALEEAGRVEEARDRAEAALRACGADRSLLAARAQVVLGRLSRRLADHVAAERHLLDAAAGFQAQGEALGEANALVELGDLRLEQGRFDEARALFHAARSAYRDHGASDAWQRVGRRLRVLDRSR